MPPAVMRRECRQRCSLRFVGLLNSQLRAVVGSARLLRLGPGSPLRWDKPRRQADTTPLFGVVLRGAVPAELGGASAGVPV